MEYIGEMKYSILSFKVTILNVISIIGPTKQSYLEWQISIVNIIYSCWDVCP